jgi:exonuclease SbcC
MIPVRLEIKNFLAYRSPDPLRFDGIHLACLTGPNGAGKSSLLDAITWALWGEARAKTDEALIHLGQNDMSVQLDFEQEGTHYRVLRQRTRKGRTGKLEVFSIVDGTLTTLTRSSMRETQEWINRLLRLDYQTFVHSAFLQQGKADAFTTRPPNQRKQILSDILGLEVWETYEAAAKERLKSITSELAVIEVRLREIDDELLKEPQLRQVLAEAEAAQQQAEAALREAEFRQNELAHVPGALKAAAERLAESERRLRERQSDLDALHADIAAQEARVASYEAILIQQSDIEAGYTALQSAQEIDSALGDKLQALRRLEKREFELTQELDQQRAALQAEISGCAATIAELERAAGQDVAGELAEVQAELAELQALEVERAALQEQTAQWGELRAELDATNRVLRGEMNELKDRITRLEASTEPACPLCGQPLTDPHRAQIIAELTAEGTARGDTYRANSRRAQTLENDIAAARARLAELDGLLKRLPTLMERGGTLQAQIDAANDAAIRLEQEQARLDAAQALLNSDSFAPEVRAQLAALHEERAALGYDQAQHDTARQQLKQLREFERRQAELNLAREALPVAQAALDSSRLRLERTQQAITQETQAAAALRAEIAQLEVQVKEYHLRQQEANRQRTLERQQYQRLINAQQELNTLDQQRQRKAEFEARREARRHEEGLYKELVLAFSKKGVPAMIIEAVVPELEQTANDLLHRMTGGRMSLRFMTQRDKLSGEGAIETLDIDIADELGTRSYELYSGGEAFRIDFAVRVALSQLLARRAGAHLRTLFIDEGFGTQDEDGRSKLVEAIIAVQDSFDLILVITHIDELRDSFPVHVVVEKTASGSRVSVR